MLTLAPTFDGKRAIPTPEITAIMLDALELTYNDVLMEIGTGSGYQTQRFAETGAEVHTIELEPWLDTTKIVGDYVYLHVGDGRIGLPSVAPFTAIVATCGIEQIPCAWPDQLAEGGRLLIPVGDSASQRLTLFRKRHGELIPERIIAYTRFQMLREKPPVLPPKYQQQEAYE